MSTPDKQLYSKANLQQKGGQTGNGGEGTGIGYHDTGSSVGRGAVRAVGVVGNLVLHNLHVGVHDGKVLLDGDLLGVGVALEQGGGGEERGDDLLDLHCL